MSPLRRVRLEGDTLGTYPIALMSDDPNGDHILLTVEEYQERIRATYLAGLRDCENHPAIKFRDLWERSATKRRLDEEVGG